MMKISDILISVNQERGCLHCGCLHGVGIVM